MSDFVLRSDRATRLSENFDYLNESGSTFYYGDTENVSSSVNIGSVTVGNSLSRRAPSWAIAASGGISNIKQQKPALTSSTISASAPPAGGTGATAGAYDTAGHRDSLITSVTNLVSDVTALQQYVKSKLG